MLDMCLVFFFKKKTASEMRMSDWSSDVCSSDLGAGHHAAPAQGLGVGDGSVAHRLLVVRAVGRQRVANAGQRPAEPGDVAGAENRPEIGRASCRDRGSRYVTIKVVAVALKKKNTKIQQTKGCKTNNHTHK